MPEDLGLNILLYEKQSRLINSLLYATANFAEHLPKILGIYRKFAERLFFKNMNSKQFSRFEQFLTIRKIFRQFFPAFRAFPTPIPTE